jgi:hypothetical protein
MHSKLSVVCILLVVTRSLATRVETTSSITISSSPEDKHIPNVSEKGPGTERFPETEKRPEVLLGNTPNNNLQPIEGSSEFIPDLRGTANANLLNTSGAGITGTSGIRETARGKIGSEGALPPVVESDDAMTSAEKELEIAEQEGAFVRNLFRATSQISRISLDATSTAGQLQVLGGYFNLLLVALEQYTKHSSARDRYLVIIKDTIHELSASMTGSLKAISEKSRPLEGSGELGE